MRSPLRVVGAIVGGIVAAYVVIMLAEVLTSRIYRMPAGVSPANSDAMKAWIQQLPTPAFALVLIGWALGAFAGGVVAAKVDRTSGVRDAIILGVLLLAASVSNMMNIPHPIWMWVGAFALIVPAAYLGARVVAARGESSLPPSLDGPLDSRTSRADLSRSR
jgi:hypothetical protein